MTEAYRKLSLPTTGTGRGPRQPPRPTKLPVPGSNLPQIKESTTMRLPVRQVRRPACLTGQRNGRIPNSMLMSIPGQGGAPVRLVKAAARCWRALCAAARQAGFALVAESRFDSYRPLPVQEAAFRERCTTTRLPARPRLVWDGVSWYLKPGKPMIAVPGTSNHGWALAVDIGVRHDLDSAAEELSDAALAWLVAHEERYGFSHEAQSDPWHIRCFVGDAIPPAVLDYERSLPMPHGGPAKADQDAQVWRIHAVVNNLPAVAGGPVKGERNELYHMLKEIDTKLDRLLAVPPAVHPDRAAAVTTPGRQPDPPATAAGKF